MAHIELQRDLELESPTLVEGLPGVGLVGKIAADHIVDALEVEYYGACYCEGVPDVAVYQPDDHGYQPPVRIYADESRDLLVLQSDVPVSPNQAAEFSTCLTTWFDEHDVTPICMSGLPQEKDGVPEMYGIATGDGKDRLREHNIQAPPDGGLVSGPTGALLSDAGKVGLNAIGLVVQANKQFPDPEAARILLLEGIEPLADIEVGTESLVEQAEEISAAKEEFAMQMQEADDESTRAQPVGMYQ